MAIIKAKQLLSHLIKWADLPGVKENSSYYIPTIQDDGVEEYSIPEGQQWSYEGEIIERILVQTNLDPNRDDKLLLWIGNDNSDWCFGMEEDIDLDKLKRYTLTILPFDL